MGRPQRLALGGYVYHVLNRANGRIRIFDNRSDYESFETIMCEALARLPMRLLAYCLMPNHWHMVLWPLGDGDLSRFVGWLSLTHAQRWHAHRESAGSGHLYQGRFKSFPTQEDEHCLTLLCYVERNALRACLVDRAEQWRWCSLSLRESGPAESKPQLSTWPVGCPANWVQLVNQPQTEAELAAVRHSIQRGQPFGDKGWSMRAARRLGLTSTFRPRGRPRKGS